MGIILLGSKAHDVVKIEDVKTYYNDRLNQLNSEILIKGKPISPMEQFLLDKAKEVEAILPEREINKRLSAILNNMIKAAMSRSDNVTK